MNSVESLGLVLNLVNCPSFCNASACLLLMNFLVVKCISLLTVAHVNGTSKVQKEVEACSAIQREVYGQRMIR